jgi:hypothetical protein
MQTCVLVAMYSGAGPVASAFRPGMRVVVPFARRLRIRSLEMPQNPRALLPR